MITLLNPEAHEVTSAVIVQEDDGFFKIVVNIGSIQHINYKKTVNDLQRYFRDKFAMEKCKWK